MKWTLVAHDADGDYSIMENERMGITQDHLWVIFEQGKTPLGSRVVALFRSYDEAIRAFPRLNQPAPRVAEVL